jgi:hypothetical protein
VDGVRLLVLVSPSLDCEVCGGTGFDRDRETRSVGSCGCQFRNINRATELFDGLGDVLFPEFGPRWYDAIQLLTQSLTPDV